MTDATVKPIRTLVVDDDASLRSVVSSVLIEDGHEVTTASSGEQAIDLFREDPCPLVFSDIKMGNMSGLELLQYIKELCPETQVVIMTSNVSLDNAVTAIHAGAYDYLIKPFEDISLISTVANRAIEKIRLMEENKALVKQLAKKNEELEGANAVLKERSIRDGLTGLYNPRYFQEILNQEVLRSNHAGRTFSLLLLGLDSFNKYIEINGPADGGKVLSTIAGFLTKGLRRIDIIARQREDEIAVLLPETDKGKATQTADNIRKYVADYPFSKRESQPNGRLTISIGVVSYPQDGSLGTGLLIRASDALSEAKKSGGNSVY